MADKYFKAIDKDEWVRNPRWLNFPADDGLDNKAYYLIGVWEDGANKLDFNLSNIVNVDWGDGSTGGSIHTYDYSTLSGPILTYDDGRNYKMAIIEFTSDQSSSDCYIILDDLSAAIFDIDFRFIGAPNKANGDPNSYSFRNHYSYYTERVKAKYPINGLGFTRGLRNNIRLSKLEVPSDMFDYCTPGNERWFDGSGTLSRVPLVYPSINNNTTINRLAIGQRSTRAIFGDINLPNASDMTSSLIHSNLIKVGDVTLPICTSTRFMFGGTVGNSLIEGIGTIDTPLVENIADMFQMCLMPEVVWTDCSSVTTTTDVFANTGNIHKLIMPGLTVGIDASYNKLKESAINEFFTSLGTANGSQTIDVSFNPGAATCDVSIASNKGFSVIT